MTHNFRRALGAITIAVGIAALTHSGAGAVELGAWKFKSEAEADLSYDSNVYNFSSAQEARMDALSAGDQTSGRFADMESTTDFILTPGIKATGKTRGFGGMDLEVKPQASYELFLSNTKKSNLELGFDVKQDIGPTSALGVEISYSPSVFKKNYLSDAVDAQTPTNGVADDDISSAERVYSEGKYSDVKVDFVYSRRVWKRGKGALGAIQKIDGELRAGFQTRAFNAPFAVRDEDSLRLGAGLDFELDNKIDVSASYLFEGVDTSVGSEVLIRDETAFGVDFNGDTDALDINTRTVQNVDRSRNEHTFAVKAGMPLDDVWYGKVRYDLRLQEYLSGETYDVTHKDRNDWRHRFGVSAGRKLSDRLTLDLAWLYTHENANRDGLEGIDPDATKSYDKHVLSAVINYEL